MCQNRTLLRAVEDLANNTTMRMLSSAILLQAVYLSTWLHVTFIDNPRRKQNASTVDILYFPTQSVYKYDSKNLMISYNIALFCSLLCTAVGFDALQYNGVAHSTAFSAIVATTRNHELDAVSRGHSLGALPLEHTSMRVKFGEIVTDERREKGREGVLGLGLRGILRG